MAPEDWADILDQRPKILWGLIADIVKAVKAGEGERRTGRRPAARVASLRELYDVLFPPTYSEDSFPVALRGLLGDRKQRAWAEEIGFSQATVSRLVNSNYQLTPELIERVAHNLSVSPCYFVEYRAMKLAQVLTDVLIAHPTLSANAARTLIGAPHVERTA